MKKRFLQTFKNFITASKIRLIFYNSSISSLNCYNTIFILTRYMHNLHVNYFLTRSTRNNDPTTIDFACKKKRKKERGQIKSKPKLSQFFNTRARAKARSAAAIHTLSLLGNCLRIAPRRKYRMQADRARARRRGTRESASDDEGDGARTCEPRRREKERERKGSRSINDVSRCAK